jgi:hypothetical protein
MVTISPVTDSHPGESRHIVDRPEEIAMTTAPRMVPLGGGPVFVDASGRRRRTMSVLGWLGAAACAIYLAAFGATMTTSAGALGELAGAALTPTPLPDEDDAGADDPADATPVGVIPAGVTPVVGAPAAVAPVRPVVAEQVRTTAAQVRTTAAESRPGTGLVELRRREPAGTAPATRNSRPSPAPRAAAQRRVAGTPVRPTTAARTARPAPASAPVVPRATGGATATPRSGATGTGAGTSGSGSSTGTSGSGTTGTGSTGTGTSGTGTSTGTTGTGTGTGTSGTGTTGSGSTGTGTTGTTGTGTATSTTGTAGPLMDAATSDILTIGPISNPGTV